jgi:hypothetical protein
MNRNLTPKRDALAALGVAPKRIYITHGVTGTNQHRPGSRAVAAADCAGYSPSGARPNARARSPTKDPPGCPDEASLGERGAPRVGGRYAEERDDLLTGRAGRTAPNVAPEYRRSGRTGHAERHRCARSWSCQTRAVGDGDAGGSVGAASHAVTVDRSGSGGFRPLEVGAPDLYQGIRALSIGARTANQKTLAQSFLMLTTVQPSSRARSRACSAPAV